MTNTNETRQAGHMYIKINEHYTATVRHIGEFITLINKEGDKNMLNVTEVSDVTEEFKNRIMQIIQAFKYVDAFHQAKATGERVMTTATLTKYDRQGCVEMEEEVDVIVLPNSKVIVPHYMQDWRDCPQKVKEGPHGDFVSHFGMRRYIEFKAA